jgi:hypothetical protein
MNVTAVMEELATACDTIEGLRVVPFDQVALTPPAALLSLPSNIDYDQSYGRGMDRLTLNLHVLVSQIGGGRTNTKAVSVYADGTGPKSVKKVLERHAYTSCDTVQVRRAEFLRVSMNGNIYLGVVFTLDITGQGG